MSEQLAGLLAKAVAVLVTALAALFGWSLKRNVSALDERIRSLEDEASARRDVCDQRCGAMNQRLTERFGEVDASFARMEEHNVMLSRVLERLEESGTALLSAANGLKIEVTELRVEIANSRRDSERSERESRQLDARVRDLERQPR